MIDLADLLIELSNATDALHGESAGPAGETMAEALFPFVPRFLMLARHVGEVRCPACNDMPGCVHRLARQLIEDVTARVKAGP